MSILSHAWDFLGRGRGLRAPPPAPPRAALLPAQQPCCRFNFRLGTLSLLLFKIPNTPVTSAQRLLISVTSPPRHNSVCSCPTRTLFIMQNQQSALSKRQTWMRFGIFKLPSCCVNRRPVGKISNCEPTAPGPSSVSSFTNQWFCTRSSLTGSVSHQAGSGLLACCFLSH